MTIIVSRDGLGAKRVEPSGVPQESYLEEWVAANPETLPLDDIKEELKLLLIARQFPTRSGPIDVLAVDSDGDIYIIETKLFRNPDKRHVVAQVLDYGAAFWRRYGDGTEFLKDVDDALAPHGGFNVRVQQGFGLEETEALELREAMRQNVKDGKLRFIVLMDALHERLKDLILFLNERSQFSIFAVEMQFYLHEGYEIVIPKLFGAEAVRPPAREAPGVWDEPRFFADAQSRLQPEQVQALRRLYEFAQSSGAHISWGRGGRRGSFNPRYRQVAQKSVMSVFSDGRIELNFKWLRETETARAFRDRYVQEIRAAKLATMPADVTHRFITVKDWHPRVEELVSILGRLVSEVAHEPGRAQLG